MANAYRGPYALLGPVEAARVRDALCGHKDPVALAIVAKCDATLNANPAWRTPTK